MKRKSQVFVGVFFISLLFVLFVVYESSYQNGLKKEQEFLMEGDAFAILLDDENVDTLPSAGTYLIDYSCDHGSEVSWNRETGELSLAKNSSVTENCILTFKTNPLVSELKQGEYVAYEGNNGCMKDGTPVTGTSNAESGNSCLGYNANDTLDTNGNTYGYCNSSNYKFYVRGWRIAYTEDSRAYLVSAGSPECNARTRIAGNITYINQANENARKYCNSAFVDGDCSDNSDAWAINDADFYKMTSQILGGEGRHLSSYYGSSDCDGIYSNQACGYNNDLIDNGGYYWFAAAYSASSTTGVCWSVVGRYVDSLGTTSAYGLRPIIRLSSSVYVTGGSGTMEDPYTIAN